MDVKLRTVECVQSALINPSMKAQGRKKGLSEKNGTSL